MPTGAFALGRVDDAIRNATPRYSKGTELLCELIEKVMCSGYEPQAGILRVSVLDHHPRLPECVAGQGDNPIEYYDPDDPVPFDAEAINKRLRGLAACRR